MVKCCSCDGLICTGHRALSRSSPPKTGVGAAEVLLRKWYQGSMSLTLSVLVFVVDDNLHDGARCLLGIHKSSSVASGPRKAGQTSSLSAWWRVVVRAVVGMSL